MLASSDREGVDSACRSMHNIDSVCIEAFSVTIHSRNLERATWSLGRLSGEVNRVKATEGARLQAEYRNLVNGLIEQGLLDGGGGGSDGNGAVVVQNADGGSGLASNVLSDDVMNESVPGNIRRAEQTVYSQVQTDCSPICRACRQ